MPSPDGGVSHSSGLRRPLRVTTILNGRFRKRNAVCGVRAYGAQPCEARCLCRCIPGMGTQTTELRSWGGVWIILGPVMFLMADFSKIESDLTYYLQWTAFAVVAVAGVWCGWAALVGDARAATGLIVLSCLVGVYFLGLGVLGFAHSGRVPLFLRLAMASFAAAWSLPFLYMAHALKSLRADRAEGAPSTHPD